MPVFSWSVVVALMLGLALQTYLALRHLRHIARHRDRVPEPFTDRIDLQNHHTAADYTRAKTILGLAGMVYGAFWLVWWTYGGGIDWLQQMLAPMTESPLALNTLLVAVFLVFSSFVELPLTLWQTFVLENRFGFNRMGPARFAADWLLHLVVSLGLGIPLLLAMFWIIEQLGDLWWLYAWMLWMAFVLTLTWAYPVLIAPLFNRFQPLPAGPLREILEALLKNCGFTSQGLYVMDSSKRSSHGNAYFTGFGNHKRIVLFDTLIEKLEPHELAAVLAHELGHFRLGHVPRRLVMMASFSLAGAALLGYLLHQPWFYAGLGVTQVSSGSAVLLFILVLPVFTQYISPWFGYLNRRQEFQADAYAVEKTEGTALVQALVKLYRDNANTLTPDPWFSAFHDSHPPAMIRLHHILRRMEQPAQ